MPLGLFSGVTREPPLFLSKEGTVGMDFLRFFNKVTSFERLQNYNFEMIKSIGG